MLAFIGLGNPGINYVNTPHNAGFLCIDLLLQRVAVKYSRDEYSCSYSLVTMNRQEVLLAKPMTFMNLSGNAVRSLKKRFEIADNELHLIYDDIDLPAGTIRIRQSGSAGAHKGMLSVLNALDNNAVPRVRIGIRPEHPVSNLAAYVLSPLKRSGQELFGLGVALAADAVEDIVAQGVLKTMNKYNKKPLASQTERLTNHKEEK